ncbi:MAG: CHAD domain-containing protein, partial [Caldilineaceae bacterium]|nr:CHAD domain-containing protein [Caldilineaceae bacterium]
MSSERKQEIEAKFIVEDHSTAKELGVAQALSDLYSLGPVQEGEYVDHYLDTADYRLLRRGYSLRLRAVGEKRLVTLKSLKVRDQAQAHSRLEIEEAIAADFAPHGLSNLPKSIRATLRRAAGKDPQWRVLCTIEQERLKRPVFKVAAAAQPIAELSLDLVAIFAGERTPESTLVDLVAEVEVELLPGFEAAEIEPIVQALGSRPDLRAGATSKLEYALAMVSRSQPITPEMAVSEACRLIWRVQLTEMLLNEFGVRTSQDIEYVHAMRVAVRRMRSAGLLFGGFFQRSAVRTYLKELRKLTRQLGAVRDLDVLERHRASFVHRP